MSPIKTVTILNLVTEVLRRVFTMKLKPDTYREDREASSAQDKLVEVQRELEKRLPLIQNLQAQVDALAKPMYVVKDKEGKVLPHLLTTPELDFLNKFMDVGYEVIEVTRYKPKPETEADKVKEIRNGN